MLYLKLWAVSNTSGQSHDSYYVRIVRLALPCLFRNNAYDLNFFFTVIAFLVDVLC